MLQPITEILDVAGAEGQVLDGVRCAGPSPGSSGLYHSPPP